MNEMYNNGNDDLFNFLKPHYSETDKLLRAIDNNEDLIQYIYSRVSTITIDTVANYNSANLS